MATEFSREEQNAARFHAHWNRRIDELAVGMLDDLEFIDEVMRLDRDARESPWAVIAIMDRRVRRGQLGGELFRGIESRIAQREFARPDADVTIDLPPPPYHLGPAANLPSMPHAAESDHYLEHTAQLPQIVTEYARDQAAESSRVGFEHTVDLTPEARLLSEHTLDLGAESAELAARHALERRVPDALPVTGRAADLVAPRTSETGGSSHLTAEHTLDLTAQLQRMVAAQFEEAPVAPPRIPTQRIRPMTPEEFRAAGVPLSDAPPAPEPEIPVVAELAAGSVLAERYVIRGLLGEGGLARVYQALDRQRRERGEIDWHVAVKVLRESTQDPQARTRLRAEYESARVLSHRNIVRTYDLGRDGPLEFFTMEFLVGQSLAKFMARFHGEPLPRDEAWSIIRDMGAALEHAHGRGVVHGDVQPQNVMMLTNGDIKLMDFGAAAARDVAQVTPGYASIEQLAGLPPDPRDDLFALACIGYELLAGTHPYAHRRASEARSAGLVPAEPRGLTPVQWQWLQRALAFERAARPDSVLAWLQGVGLETATPVFAPREPFEFESAAPLVSIETAPVPAEEPEPVMAAQAPIEDEPLPEPAVPADVSPPADAMFAADVSHPAQAMFPVEAALVPETPAKAVAGPAEVSPLVVEAWQAPAPAAASAVRPARRAAAPGRRSNTRLIALCGAVLLVAVCAWLWQRQAPDNSAALVPVAAPEPLRVAPPETATPVVKPAVKPATAARPRPAAPVAKAPAPARPAPRAAPAPGGTVSIASAGYRVAPGARFAEIKVTRTDASKPLNFTWWTEDGTALGGFEYIAQPKSTAFMKAGARSITLFVKIAGQGPRKQSVRFTVHVSRPSTGTLSNASTVVTLPAGR